jgi:hypothetical protein
MTVAIHFIDRLKILRFEDIEELRFEGGFAILVEEDSKELIALPAHIIKEINTIEEK